MSKIAINNEIVLMRKAVRQVRVAVVRKLIKEAKLLQARKHGDEKTQEKCKRKAQRLVAEIEAVKKIKDDEISKFGITNTRTLQDILSDLTCEPAARVMSRLAFNKILADSIAKFKEKFPEYEQHLGPGRKKSSKLQRQANREARNAMKRNPGVAVDADKIISDETETPEGAIVNEDASEHSADSNNEDDEDIIESEEDKPAYSNSKVDEDKTELVHSIIDDDKTGSLNPEVNEKKIEPVDSKVNDDETEPAESKIDEANDEKAAELEESLTTKYNLEPGSILRIKTPISVTKKRKNENPIDTESKDFKSVMSEKPTNNEESMKAKKMKTIKATSKETTKQPLPTLKATSEPKKPKTIKVISKEASVKRFTEFRDETQTEEIVQESSAGIDSKKRDMKIEKEVDSFFMTENGESEYLSVVAPKSKLCDNDEQQDDRFSRDHAAMRQKNFHERNNKFFSKVDQRNSGNSHSDKYGSNSGRQRSANFSNGRGQPEKFGRTGNAPARNARPAYEKKVDTKEEVLHPSWAARKKQQEILKQGFQGKKIVFGD